MSNRTNRTDRTDRPTATYPTADHLARLEREEAAHRERLNDLWADRTPTEELPLAPAAAPLPSGQPGPARVSTRPEPTGGRETPIQDVWRPRRLPAWHPSLMQLAIGAALVAALIGFFNVIAVQGYRQAATHTSSPTPSSAASEARAHDTPTPTPTSPLLAPSWVTEDTGAAYDRTDPAASPLDLPRCTSSQDTPLPCLAHVSADSARAVVLEEDASLTALVRR